MSDRSDGETEAQRGEALPQGHTAGWYRQLPVTLFLGFVSSLPHGDPLVILCLTQWRDNLGRQREPHVGPPELIGAPLTCPFHNCQHLVCFPCECFWGFPDSVPGRGGVVQGRQTPAFSILTEFGLLPTQMAEGKNNWYSLSGGQCGPENQESQSCAYPLDYNLISRDLVQRNNKAMGSMAALFIITHTQRINLNVCHKSIA